MDQERAEVAIPAEILTALAEQVLGALAEQSRKDKAEIMAGIAGVGTKVSGVIGTVEDLASRLSRVETTIGSLPPPAQPGATPTLVPPILRRLPAVEVSDRTQDDRLKRLEDGQDELRKHVKAQSEQAGVNPDAKTFGDRANTYLHSSRLLPDVVRIVLLVLGLIAASKGVTVQQVTAPSPPALPAPASVQ